MKSYVTRDITRRRSFLSFELRFNVIKTLLKSKYLPLVSKRILRQRLTCKYLSNVKLQSTIRRGCIFGWTGGVFRIWGFSRFEIKRYARLGLIPGLVKRGW